MRSKGGTDRLDIRIYGVGSYTLKELKIGFLVRIGI